MSLARSIRQFVLFITTGLLFSCGHRELISRPVTELEETGKGKIYIVSDGPNGPRGWLMHDPSPTENGVAGDLKDLTREYSSLLYHLDRSIKNKYMEDAQIIFMKYDWLPRRTSAGHVVITKDLMIKLVHIKAHPDKAMARTFVLLLVLAGLAGGLIFIL